MSRLLIIISIISLALLINCATADLVSDFCSKSNNPTLCSNVLRSDPRSRTGDSRVLAEIALTNAESALHASNNIAISLSNPGNKKTMDACIARFGDATDNLEKAKPLINRRDRGSVDDLKSKASAALADIRSCDGEFGANEPPMLKNANAEASTVVEVILIIAATF